MVFDTPDVAALLREAADQTEKLAYLLAFFAGEQRKEDGPAYNPAEAEKNQKQSDDLVKFVAELRAGADSV